MALRLNTRNGFLDRDTFLFFFIPNCLHMAKNTYPGYLEGTSVLDFVGAASSRDRFNSRLEAAPTGVFFSNLGLSDKRII